MPPRQRNRGRRRAPNPWQGSALVLRVILAISVVLVLLGVVRFVPGSPLSNAHKHNLASAPSSATGTASAAPQTPSPSPTLAPLLFRSAQVSVDTKGFLSWAVMDRRTGKIWGSTNMTQTTWTASMIKGWLASDYLRRATENGQTPSSSRLHEIEIMIRDSDNNAAQDIYIRNGRSASINRLISLCKLTDSKASSSGWSYTSVSARDTVRMANCIADGTAAGPKWTPWLLDMMRKVRGVGDFGIRKALPADMAAHVAIKNGWLLYDDDNLWHVNCMAVDDTWAMAVLERYPPQGNWDNDFQHAQDVCAEVATQLLNPAASLS